MMEENKKSISRRHFLIASGGVSLCITGYFVLPSIFNTNGKAAQDEELIEKKIDVWVRLMSDVQVIIYTPAAERVHDISAGDFS